jgi:CBS domain-containing protein
MEEIARFLHEHPPFSQLTFEQILPIAQKMQIEYFPQGKDILIHNGEHSNHLYVIRRGSVDLLRESSEGMHVFDTYGEGETFGYLSLIHEQAPIVTVRTREETLMYLLPAKMFKRILTEYPPIKQHFTHSKLERLDGALQTRHEQTSSELFRMRMRDLSRYALKVEPYSTIRQTAQLMSKHDTSCAVVMTEPAGLISDRDLRNRVVAAGMPDSSHVVRVMSSPIMTLPGDSLAFEGLMMMVEHNIHHIPVTENGKIVGVVTHTDLLRQQSRSPLLLPRQLEGAHSTEELRAYANQVEAVAGALLQGGARVRDIGRMVAVAHDALIKRLVHDAEAVLGKPPCTYAWMVMGSEGRLEQTLRTDQDNALVYADNAPQWAQVYFKDLAEHVVAQLVECGFPHCPGDIMATNPKWRQPLHVWKNYFEGWILRPDEEALMRAAIFFDYRRVYGELDIEAELRPIIENSKGQRIFLARLARAALRQSPPLGFFRNFVLERDGDARDLIDLKQRGTSLIVDLARVYALEAGSLETNTLSRLRSAAAKSSLSQSGAEELSAAFELINLFRLQHQYRQIQQGEEVNNHVPISRLSKLEQRELKDALRAVGDAQRAAEYSFRTTVLG